MSSFLPPADARLGELSIETVFEFYDAPALFVARNELGYAFLAAAVDSSAGQDTYLYVPISEQRLIGVRTGLVPLRAAFESPEVSTVFLVRIGGWDGDARVQEWPADRVQAEWLPEEGDVVYVHASMNGGEDWEYENIWHCAKPGWLEGFRVTRSEWDWEPRCPQRHIYEIELDGSNPLLPTYEILPTPPAREEAE